MTPKFFRLPACKILFGLDLLRVTGVMDKILISRIKGNPGNRFVHGCILRNSRYILEHIDVELVLKNDVGLIGRHFGTKNDGFGHKAVLGEIDGVIVL